jgi:hypothetical protein
VLPDAVAVLTVYTEPGYEMARRSISVLFRRCPHGILA